MTDAHSTAALVEAHGRVVYSFCLRLTGLTDEADDLYQETFLKAHRMTAQIDGNLNPRSFLLSLAAGIYQNERRKRHRRSRLAPQTSLDDEAAPVPEPRDPEAPDTEAERHELEEVVSRLISELNDKLKIPVLLHYMRDMPLEEIARICRIPPGTVKRRLHKARTLLKERLEAMGYAP